MFKTGKYLKIVSAGAALILSMMILAACTPAAEATPTPQPEETAPVPTESQPDVVINISADNLAFNTSTIRVPAGANVLVVFENKERVSHNVAFYTDSSASTPIYIGEIFSGPATRSYHFTAPTSPSIYHFRCDVHPTTMKGAFIVYGTAS